MLTITPIWCATLYLPRNVACYLDSGDDTVNVPTFAFLVEESDGDTAILVDTGVKETDSDGYIGGRRRADGGGFEPLRDGLTARGLEPTDIDYVIMSHLHHDHAAHTERFSEATVVVQQAELDAGAGPLPAIAGCFDSKMVEALDGMDLEVIEGDYTLMDGIELLYTPGHTEGMQTVLVETEDGTRAITADLAYTQYNLDPTITEFEDASGKTIQMDPAECTYWPPGIFVNMTQCYESIERIRSFVPDEDILLSHDPALMD